MLINGKIIVLTSQEHLTRPERTAHLVAQGILDTQLGGPLRAPHYTVSIAGLLGELSLAVGGVLILHEYLSISRAHLRRMFDNWKRMTVRPTIIISFAGNYIDAHHPEPLQERLAKHLDFLPEIPEHLVLDRDTRSPGEYSDETKAIFPTVFDRARIIDMLADLKDNTDPEWLRTFVLPMLQKHLEQSL